MSHLSCRTHISGLMIYHIGGLHLTIGRTQLHSLFLHRWGQYVALFVLKTWATHLHVVFIHRAKKKVLLVFDGVDTVASISLNGVVVGRTDNMFRRYVCSNQMFTVCLFIFVLDSFRTQCVWCRTCPSGTCWRMGGMFCRLVCCHPSFTPRIGGQLTCPTECPPSVPRTSRRGNATSISLEK